MTLHPVMQYFASLFSRVIIFETSLLFPMFCIISS